MVLKNSNMYKIYSALIVGIYHILAVLNHFWAPEHSLRKSHTFIFFTFLNFFNLLVFTDLLLHFSQIQGDLPFYLYCLILLPIPLIINYKFLYKSETLEKALENKNQQRFYISLLKGFLAISYTALSLYLLIYVEDLKKLAQH